MTSSQDVLRLWLDHMYWTRLYLVAAKHSDSDEVDATVARLLKNQDQLGANLGVVYGASNGKKYADLLRTHIVEAKGLVDAAIAGKDTKQLYTDWKANGKDIADFLHSINKNIDQKMMCEHMQMHLDSTWNEAVSILNGDWKDSITNVDKVETVIIEMADYYNKATAKYLKNQEKIKTSYYTEHSYSKTKDHKVKDKKHRDSGTGKVHKDDKYHHDSSKVHKNKDSGKAHKDDKYKKDKDDKRGNERKSR